METQLVKFGNSFGILVPDSLIQQYELSHLVESDPIENGILIKCKKKPIEGWREQLAKAIEGAQQPGDELLEAFTDEFSEQEWQW
jgi:antitoxin component of MazEF toxin-antitoxin module